MIKGYAMTKKDRAPHKWSSRLQGIIQTWPKKSGVRFGCRTCGFPSSDENCSSWSTNQCKIRTATLISFPFIPDKKLEESHDRFDSGWWWLEPWNLMFSIYWEFHHPNWRSHMFQRGRLKPPTRRRSFDVWDVSDSPTRPEGRTMARCSDLAGSRRLRGPWVVTFHRGSNQDGWGTGGFNGDVLKVSMVLDWYPAR